MLAPHSSCVSEGEMEILMSQYRTPHLQSCPRWATYFKVVNATLMVAADDPSLAEAALNTLLLKVCMSFVCPQRLPPVLHACSSCFGSGLAHSPTVGVFALIAAAADPATNRGGCEPDGRGQAVGRGRLPAAAGSVAQCVAQRTADLGPLNARRVWLPFLPRVPPALQPPLALVHRRQPMVTLPLLCAGTTCCACSRGRACPGDYCEESGSPSCWVRSSMKRRTRLCLTRCCRPSWGLWTRRSTRSICETTSAPLCSIQMYVDQGAHAT